MITKNKMEIMLQFRARLINELHPHPDFKYLQDFPKGMSPEQGLRLNDVYCILNRKFPNWIKNPELLDNWDLLELEIFTNNRSRGYKEAFENLFFIGKTLEY